MPLGLKLVCLPRKDKAYGIKSLCGRHKDLLLKGMGDEGCLKKRKHK